MEQVQHSGDPGKLRHFSVRMFVFVFPVLKNSNFWSFNEEI